MGVIKILFKVLISLSLLFIQMQKAFAEMIAKGRTKVKTVFNFYHQNGDEGKQVFDNSGKEEASVIEPMIFIEHQISEDTAITGHFVFDVWTAASDTKLDASTGASGEGRKKQTRSSATLGVVKEIDKVTLGAGVGFSNEYDYRSFNGSLDISKSFAKDNFTIGMGVQLYKDQVSTFKDFTLPKSAIISEFEDRDIIAFSVNGSQILTPKAIVFFGMNYVKASKNLESTASSVLVANTREVEALPDERQRYSVSSRLVHGVTEASAINLSYRYYWDEWDLDAHTVRLAYLFEVNDNEDYIEIFGRHHSQAKVKYFKESFDSREEFMTSDSDMAKFSSYEFGIFHSMSLGDMGDVNYFGFKFENVTLANSLVAANRSNKLGYVYLQTSFAVEF